MDSADINLAKAKASLSFGFYNEKKFKTPKIDPRIGRFEITYGHFNPLEANFVTGKELAIESLDPIRHPEFFS